MSKNENFLDTTTEQWRAEIEKLSGKRDDPGKTTKELSEELNISFRTMQKYIQILIKAGICTSGSAYRRNSAGVLHRVPVYNLLNEAIEKDDSGEFVTRLALKPREAAEALGISEKNLWNNTHPRGSIPCVKLGTRILYPCDSLHEWINKKINKEEE